MLKKTKFFHCLQYLHLPPYFIKRERENVIKPDGELISSILKIVKSQNQQSEDHGTKIYKEDRREVKS